MSKAGVTSRSLGAVVKDTSAMGLLDFYGRLEGRVVWLCWRFGEDRLGYYHELDTGFSGRRSLDAEAQLSAQLVRRSVARTPG